MPHDPASVSAVGARPAPPRMTRAERRATAGLAGIFGLRMLGMFIVLPVLALYAETLPGGRDHTLVGLALGAYGLTQAVLQIPFGWASDRWGRRPVIAVGTRHLRDRQLHRRVGADDRVDDRRAHGAGRRRDLRRRDRAGGRPHARRGAHARDGGDRHDHRRDVRAVARRSGRCSSGVIGVPGIFVLTGVLALGAIALYQRTVPNVPPGALPDDTPAQWRQVLADGQLLRLNYGIFALHAALMALFVQVPFMLRDNGVPPARHWIVYLSVLAASVVLMLPGMLNADRPGRGKPIFIGAIAVLFAGQALLAIAGASLALTVGSLVVFFTAFNLLEATLPSLVSKFAPPAAKGTAVGVYSSVQFLGTFVGAAGGGWLSQHHGPAAVFGFCLVLTALWLVASATMSAPPAYNQGTYSMGET